jgi:hypothetical protein
MKNFISKFVKTRKPINCCYTINIDRKRPKVMFSTTNKDSHLLSTNNNSRFDFFFSGQYLLIWDWFQFVIYSSNRQVRILLKSIFYTIIFPAIIPHPPVIFFRIFNKLRIFSVRVFRVPEWCCSGVLVFRVPVFRCSGVPGFTNSH